ncbi:AAA family ATPase [Saccharothrix sp. NRRL B-16314]|uniref:AAA family ATPase n=1 Tax=Saccharothrix sp. NRRL B-16314 TaxID=1463825 RepID=UPI000524B16F|nr:ATP-binding protein [Saccharothrix sp. NRRL B-16314]
MIVWLNGTFGAGKTTTAGELAGILPNARIFDSEQVGYLLRHVMTEPVENFQDWAPWRPLVARTAVEILRSVGGTLVIPQTVLNESYLQEIFTALRDEGLGVRHFLLHVAEGALVDRIKGDGNDPGAHEWRLSHVDRYQAALPWLRDAAEVIDTTSVPAPDVARKIAARLGVTSG